MKFNVKCLRSMCTFLGACVLLAQVAFVSAKLDTNKFERKIIALRKVLQFMKDRPEQMNLDATFGVTLVEAQIQAALQHKNIMFLDNYEQNAVKKIRKLADETRELLKNAVKIPYKKLAELLTVAHLTNTSGWIKPIVWESLKPNFQISKHRLKLEYILSSFNNGHPNEAESDACLNDLISECKLTDQCRNIIMEYESSTGYPLTHKLLIVQVMESVGCETSVTKDIPRLKKEYCLSCFQELQDFEALRFPSISKDLSSEQMLLCGMEGYLDFLTEHYEQLILDWQHPSGCYSGVGDYPKDTDIVETRHRREAFYTDFGCVNHATALAAAVLALLIRKDIELLI